MKNTEFQNKGSREIFNSPFSVLPEGRKWNTRKPQIENRLPLGLLQFFHQSRNKLGGSSLSAFLRLPRFLFLRVCVFDALTMGGLWSDCVAVLSQSQWVCQSSSGWKTLSFLASCSNCLLRGLFCSVPVPLPPLACVSFTSCRWTITPKAIHSFLNAHLEICSSLHPAVIIYPHHYLSVCSQHKISLKKEAVALVGERCYLLNVISPYLLYHKCNSWKRSIYLTK